MIGRLGARDQDVWISSVPCKAADGSFRTCCLMISAGSAAAGDRVMVSDHLVIGSTVACPRRAIRATDPAGADASRAVEGDRGSVVEVSPASCMRLPFGARIKGIRPRGPACLPLGWRMRRPECTRNLLPRASSGILTDDQAPTRDVA